MTQALHSIPALTVEPATPGVYQVGSLSYDRRGLTRLFFWLLLGDFCWNVMETALPKLLPLQLDSQGIQASGIAWMMSTGSLAALVFSPLIGVWSDRLRTRWGRRRPFLIASTPIMAVGLLLIPHVHNYYLLNLVVMLIQVMNVLQTVMLYLYADIMPANLMGRFMAAFRLVGFAGGLAFQTFLFPHFGTNPVMVWTVCAVVYLVVFQLSLHVIREGKYPQPEPLDIPKIIKGYIKEGLTGRYIWMLWLAMGMCALGTPAGYFTDLFGKHELKMTIQEIARINAYAMIPTLILTMPCGWLIDKYGPRLIWGSASFVSGIISITAFFLIQTKTGLQWLYISNSCLGTLMAVALMPMLYAHLPRNKFGQFTSTQSLVVHTFIFCSANGLGQLIGLLNNNYRFALLYGGFFVALTPIFVLLLRVIPCPFNKEELAMVSPGETTPITPTKEVSAA